MSTEGESRPGQSFPESHHVEAVIFASREDISALLKSLHTVETRLASIRKEIDGLHIHIDLGKGKEQTWKRIQDQGLESSSMFVLSLYQGLCGCANRQFLSVYSLILSQQYEGT